MATQKIELFDAVNDILVEVDVSVNDVERAATDTLFATQLLNHVLEKQGQSSTSNNYHENVLLSNDSESYINTEDTGETQKSEVSLYMWSSLCVMLLLENYRAREKEFNGEKLSKKKIWEKISKALKEKGYDVTGPQCSSKLRSLKKSYKSIKDHNNKSGNDRRSWQFFDIMEDIFAKKAWCDPVAVASSTGLSVKQPNNDNSIDESDSGCSTKPSKTQIVTLLEKRLKQKEEHEEQKIKRHKERMEMDEKVLEKLPINKCKY